MIIEVTPKFERDLKRALKKHFPINELKEVIELIEENSSKSEIILTRRHNKHTLKGNWHGAFECHISNIGDWLLVWRETSNCATLLRTGKHDEIFRNH